MKKWLFTVCVLVAVGVLESRASVVVEEVKEVEVVNPAKSEKEENLNSSKKKFPRLWSERPMRDRAP